MTIGIMPETDTATLIGPRPHKAKGAKAEGPPFSMELAEEPKAGPSAEARPVAGLPGASCPPAAEPTDQADQPLHMLLAVMQAAPEPVDASPVSAPRMGPDAAGSETGSDQTEGVVEKTAAGTQNTRPAEQPVSQNGKASFKQAGAEIAGSGQTAIRNPAPKDPTRDQSVKAVLPRPEFVSQPAPVRQQPASALEREGAPALSEQLAARLHGGESQAEADSGSSASQGRNAMAVTVQAGSPQLSNAPFRMELSEQASQALSEVAVSPETGISPEVQRPVNGDFPSADITIELGATDGLDVTIVTSDTAIHERLKASHADLHQDLAAIGAEVEAIHVELRPPHEPTASGPASQQPGDGRSGQWIMQQREQQHEQGRQRFSGKPDAPHSGVSVEQALARGSAENRRQIDRYA